VSWERKNLDANCANQEKVVDAQNAGKFTTEPRRHRGKLKKTEAERLKNWNHRGTAAGSKG
jgi:hypothetical protein